MDNMDKKRFPDYSFDELLLQESFQQWVKQPDASLDEYWVKWLEQYPAKRDLADKAGALLKAIYFRTDELSGSEQQELWTRIQAGGTSGAAIPERNDRLGGWKVFRRIAAVFIGAVLLGGILFWAGKNMGNNTIATEYGRIRTIVLPDSSLVILNAHSSIRYAKRWQKDKTREVWITGEAYFKVRHLNVDMNNIEPGERFVVHAGGLEVEVLGTVFDVKDRRGKIEVGLNSGRVCVSVYRNGLQARMLSPGEVVQYDEGTGKLTTMQTNASALSAWIENRMVLTDAPVSAVIRLLEDNYGYKVTVEDTDILNRKLNGAMFIEDDKDILFVLEHVLNIRIVEHGNELIFKAK